MSDFILKLLPLYGLIFFGWFIGRRHHTSPQTLATVNIQFFAPLVFFNAIQHMPFRAQHILLPFIAIGLMGLVCVIVYLSARRLLPAHKNWLAATLPCSNTGYFGLPVAALLFGQAGLGQYVLFASGATVFFLTVTTYLFSAQVFNPREAVWRVLRIPGLWAVVLGVICRVNDWQTPAVFDEAFMMARHTFTAVGMMLIGMILSTQSFHNLDKKVIAYVLAVRYALWPLIMVLFILIDRVFLQVFQPKVHHILMLVAILPMGADSAAYAAQWNVEPGLIGFLVLLTSILALPLLMGVMMVF